MVRNILVAWMVMLMPALVLAQSVAVDSKQPIEISADTLEVFQNDQKAIFSGNVIARQGNINMKSSRMQVYYKGGGDDVQGAMKGISKIVADGGVFFAAPRETARGGQAVYDVDRQMVTMAGDVVLTRDKNVLKGTQLVYNLATGKSVLSAASTQQNNGGRVKGIFVPSQKGSAR